MTYTDTERLECLLNRNRADFRSRQQVDSWMTASGYKRRPDPSNLLPPERDPYALTRTGPVPKATNSGLIDLEPAQTGRKE